MSFTCQRCGGCCGPIPLVDWQFDEIRKAISKMPTVERDRLKNQPRGKLTCILLDAENKRCTIYDIRPLVCRQYGQVRQLKCPNNERPSFLIDGGKKILANMRPGEKLVGILSMNIGWAELEGKK